MQADLLANVPLIELARARGRQMAELCADKAERVADFDTEGARRATLGLLARHGRMSGEQLTDALKALGFHPHSDKSFGAVYGSLSRRKQIVCVGHCDREKGHGTAGGRIWEAAP